MCKRTRTAVHRPGQLDVVTNLAVPRDATIQIRLLPMGTRWISAGQIQAVHM
jgi:hypothetical protein